MSTSSNYDGLQSARVSFINVERQFKLRGIPFTHVNPTSSSPLTPELAQMQSSLARSVPALCVQSKHILSGAPAAEAAMPNIRVIPLNWWSEEKAQVSFTFSGFVTLIT
jgi:mediator of RNA polymerase II transcription subunit 14